MSYSTDAWDGRVVCVVTQRARHGEFESAMEYHDGCCDLYNPQSYFSFQPVLRNSCNKFIYLTTHSTHCIYGYMASDILWQRTTRIAIEETSCRLFMDYTLRLVTKDSLYGISAVYNFLK